TGDVAEEARRQGKDRRTRVIAGHGTQQLDPLLAGEANVDEGHVAGRPGILALVANVAMRIDRLDAFGFEPFLEQFEGCAVCFDDQHLSPYVRSCGHSAIPFTSLSPLGPRRLAPELRTR